MATGAAPVLVQGRHGGVPHPPAWLAAFRGGPAGPRRAPALH
jgi:hypothetical protein